MITLLEDEDTRLISNDAFQIGGNLTYLGGGGVDTINFKSTGATIDGFIYVDVATSTDAENQQRVLLTGGFSAASVVVDGGNSTAGIVFSTDVAINVTGNVIVNFATGTASNTVTFRGSCGGTYGTYRGSQAMDSITVGATASSMEFAILANDGDDVLTVENTTDLDFLYGDMGGGVDSLDNQFGGEMPFNNNIFNL